MSQTLRVAIIGSGPSAFYAADHLQKQPNWTVEIDMFERLPTPFGLVRGGVAPDHPKIKSVTKIYDKIASHPLFRFYGNVTLGCDISHTDLLQHYHAIIYAVGAQTDRRMDIPGEDLAGSYPATEFVGWYNGHPDYRHLTFDLSQERVAVVGNGNVAMDVARILAQSQEELKKTDIADYALEALKNSKVREIHLLGRRGPAQAAFTTPELKEMGELIESDLVIDPCEAEPCELELDALSRAYIDSGEDRTAEKNVELLMQYARRPLQGKPKRVIMRFLVSPVEILGTERVEAVKVVKNELYQREDGSLRPRPTDQFQTLPIGLIFRSIGYLGVALPDIPFNERSGTIPNKLGRITGQDSQPIPGEYVVGWIKRGPTGIIGTNKPDSQETVNQIVDDWAKGLMLQPTEPTRAAVEAMLRERNICYVSYEDWLALDQLEQERGAALNRPRVKFCSVEDMLTALAERKTTPS
jgi:ferredoxin--NADP+ reductase